MIKFLNEEILTEISKDYIDKAIERQESLLKRKAYLQKISAWQYIKCINRLEDFKKYAQAIADSINSGEIGSPDDPKITKREADAGAAAINTVKKNAEEAAKETEPEDIVTPEERREEVAELAPENVQQSWPEPIIPKFPFAGKLQKGKYLVVYISHINNEEVSIWVDANCIKNAIKAAVSEVNDIKEIKNVVYDADYKEAENPETQIVNPDQSTVALANDIADKISDGQFDNLPELVADIKDDETTVKCATGDEYSGIDNTGREWSGPKSSYMEVLKSDEAKYTDDEKDYGIDLVVKINPDGEDTKIEERFNLAAFKKALNKGIVHFNYIKKTDGSERQAFGTTNAKILDDNNASWKSDKRENPNVIRYFDMTSRAWRSCMLNGVNLIYDEMWGEKLPVNKPKRGRGRPKKNS